MANSGLAAPEAGLPTADIAQTVRPYGWLGLLVSLVLIVIASLVLIALAVAGSLALAGLILGWHETAQRLDGLRTTIGSDKASLQRAGVVVSLALYSALTLAVLAAARFRGGARWRDLLGLRPWHPLRGARLFWIATGLTILYGFGADAVVSKFYPPSQEWVSLPAGRLWIALFIFLAIVLAPITEELFFRGWLYTSLRAKIGVWSAILLTSILFAVAHWETTHIYALIVFPVGLMLGFVRERTGSLTASMAFHALFNGAASAVLLFSQ